jgi:hypothetical protein
MKKSIIAALCAVGLLAAASSAAAVPISVPKITVNDGHDLKAVGRVWSPPSASACSALVRAQVQVASPYGWRVVRSIGRFRVDVCQGSTGRWTYGDVYVHWWGTEYLRSQPARLCWQAHQTVNGYPSKHNSCKLFQLRGGS